MIWRIEEVMKCVTGVQNTKSAMDTGSTITSQINNMKLSDTEKDKIKEEWLNLEVEYNPFQTAEWWLTKFEAILEKKEKDIVEMSKIENIDEHLATIYELGKKINEIINKLNNK